MPTVKFVWLFKDGADGIVAGIDYESERSGMVREGKDRGLGEGHFQELEGVVGVRGPEEGGVFLGEVE